MILSWLESILARARQLFISVEILLCYICRGLVRRRGKGDGRGLAPRIFRVNGKKIYLI